MVLRRQKPKQTDRKAEGERHKAKGEVREGLPGSEKGVAWVKRGSQELGRSYQLLLHGEVKEEERQGMRLVSPRKGETQKQVGRSLNRAKNKTTRLKRGRRA